MALPIGKAALLSALAAALALAPSGGAAAQPVVQAVPPPALGTLQTAQAVLARNPENFGALLSAGWASLELGDVPAAQGFFRRAEAINPRSGEVIAGMATIELRQGDPVDAIRLFAQAEALGAPMMNYASDRGLALDLVGSNVAAQRFYRQALALNNDPEVVRRLALSQAIAGDRAGSETTLLPLLQRSDLAAYRIRAFALAILGQSDEAISIAQAMLPASLSNRMAPYLRYMPRLTRAQQAAATHLGRFPAAADIGRDSPAIAALAGGAPPPQASPRTPDSRLEPAGPPLGSAGPARPVEPGQPAQPTAVAVAQPAVVQPAVVAAPAAAPPPQPALPPDPRPAPVVVAVAQSEPSSPAWQPAEADVSPRPSFSISAPPEVAAAETVDEVPLAEAFADFSLPPSTAARPAVGAVDITRIDPPRERPKAAEPKAAEPKPPAHPRRYWVQVATGRDTSALAFDWRRIKREGGDLLARRDAFTAGWGQTNRLVTGPYPDAAAAQKAVTDLKAKGVDSFMFTSSEGEEVKPLR